MRRIIPSFIVVLFVAGALNAQGNLVKNGEFNDTLTTHWDFSANDAQASGKIELNRYLVSIENPGHQESSPQVSQRGIALEASEGYTLSFKVSASDTGKIRVYLESESRTLYSDSAKGKIPVNTTSTTHSIVFFVTKSAYTQGGGQARLVFNCGLSSNLTRISIDSVTLVKLATPLIHIDEPSADFRWVSGTERRITWQNSGTLEVVKIRFSSDDGSSWSTITEAASNQNSFWWSVPVATSGNACRIIVSDTTGLIADTTESFSIVASGTIDAKEMVKNGSFLDTGDWKFSVSSPAKASGTISDDQYVIKIDTAGSEAWHVKLEQPGFSLENGTMYRFAFDAYASHDRTIYANVGADNGNPAWSVYGGDTVPVQISTTSARYTQTIIMKYPTSDNIRIEFNCGNDTGTVYIDNVSMIQLESADVFIINPSLGSILKSGSKINIEWQAADIATVDLDYSLDSGVTWTAILDAVDNLGVLAWNVPEVSSELCFIRIRDAESDSVIGMSAQFQINKFGAAVKTGELVVNGTFANNQRGWNTSFSTAVAMTDFTNEEFAIEISEPGADLNSIVLSQSNLPVLEEKEYTLSFDAFANGTRGLGVAVISDDNTVKLLDTVVDLPSVSRKISFKFTAPADAMTRLEFRMGGAHAGVFIDNVSFYTGSDPSVGIAAPMAAGSLRPVQKFTATVAGRNVTFRLPQCESGLVSIYNLKGVRLCTLPAQSVVKWNCTTNSGSAVARGSYIAMLTSKNMRMAHRFIVR